MNYKHPTLVVSKPAPGHYAISGFRAATVFVPGTGHIVPPDGCYITDDIPDDLLLAILEDRKLQRGEAAAAGDEKPKRGRKAKAPAGDEKPGDSGAGEEGEFQ